MSNKDPKKSKKEKITYVDDGRTIADMSGISGGRSTRDDDFVYHGKGQVGNSFKDRWHTYINAVKMMIAPMLVTIGFLILAFVLVYLFL